MENLNKNPWEKFEDSIEGDIPTATLQIYQGITEKLERKKDVNVNRASAATMCVRRRWYQAQGFEGTPLTPRKIANFLMGDLAEKTVVYFIKTCLVGPGKMYSEVDFGDQFGSFNFNGSEICVYSQKTLSWKINEEITVTAHVDGLGKRNSDGKWELIEVKSASDYGFDSFKENGPGEYINQAHACMLTQELTEKGVREVRYYYLKKNTGNLFDRVFAFQDSIAERVRKEYIQAQTKEAPQRPYGFVEETFRKKPTGRQVLTWVCGYCPFVSKCHPNAVKEFKNGAFGVSKPVFVKQGENNES